MAALCGHTEGDLVGAPLSAWLGLGHQIFMTSCVFESLPVYQAVSYFDTGLITGVINRDGEPRAALLDFMHRGPPEAPARMTWVHFTRYYLRRRIADEEGGAIPAGGVLFSPSHPNHETHYMGLRTRFVYPVPKMKRLTDWKQLTTTPLTMDGLELLRDDPSLSVPVGSVSEVAAIVEKQETFASHVIFITLPFEHDTVWRDPGESWWQAFVRHSLMITPAALKYLQRVQNYHEAFARNSADSLEEGMIGIDALHNPMDVDQEQEAFFDEREEDEDWEHELPATGSTALDQNLHDRHQNAGVPPLPLSVAQNLVIDESSFANAVPLLTGAGSSFAQRYSAEAQHAVPSDLVIPARQYANLRETEVIALVDASFDEAAGSLASPAQDFDQLPPDRPGVYESVTQYGLQGPQREVYVIYASLVLLEVLKITEGPNSDSPVSLATVFSHLLD